VAVIRLPHIANFDDFDPLRAEPEVELRLVQRPAELDKPDLIVLPGTKTTIADLEQLRRVGLDEAIFAQVRRGVPVMGICGGYQMLGRRLLDPLHVESSVDESAGLGLLPVETVFEPVKSTQRVKGRVPNLPGLLSLAAGEEVEGYEIHMGSSRVEGAVAVHMHERAGQVVSAVDGAVSDDGLVVGTYLHGLFDRPGFRRCLLRWLAERKGVHLVEPSSAFNRERAYDRLAAVVRGSIDMQLVYGLLGQGERP
jgi:adenosylcobyric acid synthase